MNKGFAIAVASVIVGCVGLGHIIGSRKSLVIEEMDEDWIEESVNVIEQVIEEVKEYMNNKVNTVAETIQFCKDILSNGSYRATLGVVIVCAGIGIGGGLIASAYIPLPTE